MGKCKFVGYRHVDYVAKDGRKVEGYSLYFTEERNHVEGVACFDSFVGVDVFTDYFSCVSVGSTVEVFYNRYGRISGCTVIF